LTDVARTRTTFFSCIGAQKISTYNIHNYSHQFAEVAKYAADVKIY